MLSMIKKMRQTRRISSDLQQTMTQAFDHLRRAIDLEDEAERHHEIHARLTSLSIALHDVYPAFPQERDSLFLAFVAADMDNHPDTPALRGAIENHIRDCPDIPAAKFDFMTYLLAPKMMSRNLR